MDIYDLALDSKDLGFAKRLANIAKKTIDELYLDEISSSKKASKLLLLFDEIINNENIINLESVMNSYIKKHNQFYDKLNNGST